jgi:hypothetical protein
MAELFKFIARLGGAHEIDAMFKRAPMQQPGIQVMPDEQVQAQAQSGQLAPMDPNGFPQ